MEKFAIGVMVLETKRSLSRERSRLDSHPRLGGGRRGRKPGETRRSTTVLEHTFFKREHGGISVVVSDSQDHKTKRVPY